MILGFLRRRRERRAAEREAQHVLAQALFATDMAITLAVRARLAEPVTSLDIVWPLRVTVGDVLSQAQDHFRLELSEADAAKLLRYRLELRGHSRWPDLVTDAYDPAYATDD
ncbi:hypothetical protein [Streptomyces sp. NPDC059604]|uniref:hypothetical protein n=1 Tax=Streptomyces sp. NPDC059604 TaxID=3346881 RepID=UPI00369B967C